MPGHRRHHQRATVAWVEHEVVDDLAQEDRTLAAPAAVAVAAEDPGPFARPDEELCRHCEASSAGDEP